MDARLSNKDRVGTVLLMLPLILWVVQVRYSSLSFPAFGLMELIVLAGGAVLLSLRVRSHGLPVAGHPAVLPGLLFLGWLVARWATTGLGVRGLEVASTALGAALYAGLGFIICQGPGGKRFPLFLLMTVMALAAVCGLHAGYQYFVGYDRSYRDLLASIGGRAPDQMELGLLYHLKLKRVASILGDPNALATLLALGLTACLELAAGWRGWRRATALAAGIMCLGGISFTGSRGGLLDVGLVVIIMAWLVGRSRGWRGAAAVGIIGLCVGMPQGIRGEGAVSGENAAPVSGWTWRSSTIQERVYYLEVGAKMIRMNPVAGLGPGSVDRYFGRLKSPEARETRYLHNWVMQAAAELGLVGVGLMGWFFAAVLWRCFRGGVYRRPVWRGIGVMVALFLLDGLVQITWNQRELMGLLGLCLGVLMGVTAGNERKSEGGSALALGGLIAVAVGLCVIEVPYLKSKSAKQMATDMMSVGDMTEAKKYWQRAKVWLPMDPDPAAALSGIYLGENQLTAARNSILEALRLQPESAALNARAGEVFRELGEPDKADIFLTNALTYYPTKPEYLFDMAEFQRGIGHPDRALTFARRALQYNFMEEDRGKYQALVTALESATSGTKVTQ